MRRKRKKMYIWEEKAYGKENKKITRTLLNA